MAKQTTIKATITFDVPSQETGIRLTLLMEQLTGGGIPYVDDPKVLDLLRQFSIIGVLESKVGKDRG